MPFVGKDLAEDISPAVSTCHHVGDELIREQAPIGVRLRARVDVRDGVGIGRRWPRRMIAFEAW